MCSTHSFKHQSLRNQSIASTYQRSMPQELLILLVMCVLLLLMTFSSSVKAQGVVVNANSCPFATLLSNLHAAQASASTNFTDLMIQNPSQFACDALPNSAFDYYPEGVLFTASAHTTVINIENTNRSFCGVDGGFGRERNLRICNDLFSNDTLAESLFLPYLESFRKNFTSFAGFKSINAFYDRKNGVQVGNMSTSYNSLVHAFNYCLYCREENPLFNKFHTEFLPNLVKKSVFSQVQTLQILFGDFKKNYGENSVIPFFNRTIFTFCKNSNTQQFTAMSQYACHDSYVVFWTPFASHLSFKIIELFLFFIQFVIGVLVVLIPLTQRHFLKWRNYFKYVNDRKLIGNSHVERIKKIENTSNCVSSVPSSPNMETVPSSTSVTTGSPTSPTETPLNKTQQASSKTPKPETLLEIGLRVACDLNLLSAVNMTLSMLSNVLVSLTFISITYYKGTAIYPEETFSLEMISVELMVLANVPLALTFLSIVMKLDKTKRRVSLYGIVIVFILCFLLLLLILVLFFVSFGLPIYTQKVTRVIALPFVLVALVVCWTVILIDTVRTYRMLKKNNVKVSFFQFRFSRYIFIPITLSIYLLYDIPAEAGLITASFSIDIFWAFMWKHRVEVYMICILNWGLVYVLFNKNRFLYCYQKPLSLCMSQDAIRKINKDQNKEQNNL